MDNARDGGRLYLSVYYAYSLISVCKVLVREFHIHYPPHRKHETLRTKPHQSSFSRGAQEINSRNEGIPVFETLAEINWLNVYTSFGVLSCISKNKMQ